MASSISLKSPLAWAALTSRTLSRPPPASISGANGPNLSSARASSPINCRPSARSTPAPYSASRASPTLILPPTPILKSSCASKSIITPASSCAPPAPTASSSCSLPTRPVFMTTSWLSSPFLKNPLPDGSKSGRRRLFLSPGFRSPAIEKVLVTLKHSAPTHHLPLFQSRTRVSIPPAGKSGVSCPLGGPMWGNKKPEGPPAAQPEIRNLPANQPPKPAPATWEGTSAMSTDAMRPLGATADRATARLGASLHVKGEISGNEDLVIDGSVEGLVQLDDKKLTVGATAKVTADIIAREVVVYGTVKGNLRAKDRIEIKKDGSVNGDLTTARIMIEDGAYFKGSIEIDTSAEKEHSSAFTKSSSAPAAAAAGPKSI